MAIGSYVKTAFDPSVRSRGQQYFRERRVRHISSRDSKENFQVRGSEKLYQVAFEYQPQTNTLKVTCECLSYASGAFCKHLWATVLRADELKLFSELTISDGFHLSRTSNPGAGSVTGGAAEGPTPDYQVKVEPAKLQDWRDQVRIALSESTSALKNSREPDLDTALKRITYVLQLRETIARKSPVLRFFVQERLRNGSLGVLKPYDFNRRDVPFLEDPLDRDLLLEFFGKADATTRPSYGYAQTQSTSAPTLDPEAAEETLLRINTTSRLAIAEGPSRLDRSDIRPYEMQDEEWNLELDLSKPDENFYLRAHLKSVSGRVPLYQSIGNIGQLVFFKEFCARSNVSLYPGWADLFANKQAIEIPAAEINRFLELVLGNSNLPQINFPPELAFTEVVTSEPEIHCKIAESANSSYLSASLTFKYDEHEVSYSLGSPDIFDIPNKHRIKRDLLLERKTFEQFRSLGLPTSISRVAALSDTTGFIHTDQLSSTCEHLLAFGWKVFLKQVRVRTEGALELKINAGVDWFDVNGSVKFDDTEVSLPDLLKHLKSDEKFIQLKDGTQALVSEKWKAQLHSLAKIGLPTKSGVRLSKIQFLFMNSLLHELPGLQDDKKLPKLSKLLKELSQPSNVSPAASFKGKLRPYQKEGLGWLTTLSDEHLGGILADDMGLGKTVQVLALVSNEKSKLPNLVVAPKSLVFNWAKEAEQFTPKSKVLSYVGPNRKDLLESVSEHDLVITTYPSLRADIEDFQKLKFNLVIFDEAHFIKNSSSQTFKACQLLQAEKRFSLTGTPVENSVNDLLSILSLTLPGLLSDAQKASWARLDNQESRLSLSKAVSPFVLRRTKEKVLKDLPEKSEQILYCELSPTERTRYDELKKYYWSELSEAISKDGVGKSKIKVLEALLRLRQASCHIGLIDKNEKNFLSAKFELLLEQITEVIQEGHKVLIFSQFTSLLGLLKEHLLEKEISFAYLDGKTKDRQEVVERFQSDEGEKVFLLSLKAGGVGLNLTSADYVYVLDPWWNPAAESQAIDRAHRIGQKNKVFAYKIIAKDTIEEKILELQRHKKQLAADLVQGEATILRSLKLDDLKMLFE